MERERVYAVLEAGLTHRSAEGAAVIFGFLVSLGCTSALGAGLYWMMARDSARLPGYLVAIALSWVIGYFAGRALADEVGIADGAFQAAADAQQSFTQRGWADDLLALGCLTIGAQFLFGNLYRAARYLRAGSSNRLLVVATGVMSALLAAGTAVKRQDVTQQLVDAGATVQEAHQAIALLKERGYLEGEAYLEVGAQRRDEFKAVHPPRA